MREPLSQSMNCLRVAFLAMVVIVPINWASPSQVSEDIVSQTEIPNANIQYLFSMALEKITVFDNPAAASSESPSNALLPEWMREDLNLLAVTMYERFQEESRDVLLDGRDAESSLKLFREWQMRAIPEWSSVEESSDSISPAVRDSLKSLEALKRVIAKIGVDFLNRVGGLGPSRYFYQTRIWAEVLGPGDAVAPTFMATNGGQIAGLLNTHIPKQIKGTPIFEIMDPRGHNPPFGKDEKIPVVTGVAHLFPAWATRMTPPHRCCKTDVEEPSAPSDTSLNALKKSHRIDWVFEIGLFQFTYLELTKHVDWEMCPFRETSMQKSSQSFFNVNLEELIAIAPPPDVVMRIEHLSKLNK